MKLLVITTLFLIGIVQGEEAASENVSLKDDQRQNEQQLSDEFKPSKLVDSFSFGNKINDDIFSFDIDDSSNEIPRSSFYPMYQALTAAPSASSSTLSTHLKQVSSPVMTANQPTPVIMQYVSQNLPGTGIQYLQLIPTSPLIVPISPYITSGGFSPLSSYSPTSAYTQSVPSTTTASRPFLGVSPSSSGRTLTTSMPAPFHPPMMINYPARSSSSVGLSRPAGAVTSSLSLLSPNYRYVRPNAVVEVISSSSDITLNTNEFMPKPGLDGPIFRSANRIS